jgi:hypothetical protein
MEGCWEAFKKFMLGWGWVLFILALIPICVCIKQMGFFKGLLWGCVIDFGIVAFFGIVYGGKN